MGLRSSVEAVMYGRRRSALLEPFLLACSLLYRALISIRTALYRVGLIGSRSLPCRVISVGNLTLGGTGKTPTVIQIAKLLADQGKRPVVLTRGYGRANESETVVVSDGDGIRADALQGGDEPLLMASRLTGIPVIAGRDRFAAGMLASERFQTDTAILDDGFQNLRLKRDLNIVLIDASDPFGNGRLFPAGILREPLSAFNRADAVLITRVERENAAGPIKERVRKHTKAPVFTAYQAPVSLTELRSGARGSLEKIRGCRVLAFTGIARPSAFFSMLRDLGASVLESAEYPDHYRYQGQDLAAILRSARAAEAEMIITTEKDAVKFTNMDTGGIWSLGIEQKVRETEAWERLVKGTA